MYSIYLRIEGGKKSDIESFRQQYDTLAHKIECHITVVFPFSDDVDLNGIMAAMDTLIGMKSFSVSFDREITFEDDVGYLKVLEGQDIVRSLFKQLNDHLGIKSVRPYLPHMTVVRGKECQIKSVDFETSNYLVNEVVLEYIGIDDSSIVEYTIKM